MVEHESFGSPEKTNTPENRQALLKILEAATGMGHFGYRLSEAADVSTMLSEIAANVEAIHPFKTMAFLLVDEVSHDFVLSWCSSSPEAERITEACHQLMEDHMFSWALRRNHPTTVTLEELGDVLLHPLQTSSGPVGMFVGVLQGDKPAEDVSYYLLSMTLVAASIAIENFFLYKQLSESNSALEEKVASRTEELSASNMQLRRTLQEKDRYKQHLELLFSSMQDVMISVDPELIVQSINRAGEDLFGVKQDDVVGKMLPQVMPDLALRCDEFFHDVLSYGERIVEERVELLLDSDARHIFMINCSPFASGVNGQRGAMLMLRDITRLVSLEEQLQERRSFKNIIGTSKSMLNVYSMLENLVDLDTTVLVTGESGTGKELVAEALHHNGARANGPLVRVNCSALSENLLESELFGHVRVAFTGATKDKVGRFEAAEGGTIFLDEIGDISLRIQVLLLRFLESHEFERVGDTVTRKANVRIVAATNADLQQRVAQGVFRSDLFYRLNVMNVHLPPLRERLDDMALLVQFFIDMFNDTLGVSISGVSEQVMQVFMNHPWPGNIRELKHTIEHASILARSGRISLDHLPVQILGADPLSTSDVVRHPPYGGGYGAAYGGGYAPQPLISPNAYMPASMQQVRVPCHTVTAEEVQAAIASANGNKTAAAKLLGMGRATLYRKLKELGLA
jgi:PAS domain S-box-containing protein